MKKVLFIIFSIFLFTLSKSQAPTFQWARAFGMPSYFSGSAIITDKSGNVYTTGCFQGTQDFDPGPGTFTLTSSPAGKNDIFVSKFDANGNFKWAKRMGANGDDYGNGIAVDRNCNVYTVGSFTGTVDFNPGAGIYLMTAPGGFAAFIQKLDSLGNFIWANQISSSIKTICIDDSANVFFGGACSSLTDFDPGPSVYTISGSNGGFVEKLDSTGNFKWAKPIGYIASVEVLALKLDDQKNIYITGYFGYTNDFDPGPGTFTLAPKSTEDIFVERLSPNGNFIWAKAMGSTSPDYGYGISVDKSHSVYITGEFRGTCDFNPNAGIYNLSPLGLSDIFLTKLDSLGNFMWAQKYGDNWGLSFDEAGYGITNDALDNVYVTGNFHGIVDFDPGPGTYTLSAGAAINGFAPYIQKLNSNGNFIWAGAMTALGTGQNEGKSITLDRYNNIYSSGIAAPVDFDTGPGTYTAGSGGFSSYVHKLCQAPLLSSINSPVVFCPSSNYTLSVDSFPGTTSYAWTLPSGVTGTSTTNVINITTGLSGGGTMSLTVSNSCGVSTKTMNITITPTVPLNVTSSTICVGNAGTISASGAATFSWSTGATTSSITVSPTTTTIYSVTGNASGCVSDTKTVSITVNPLPLVSASSPTFPVCSGTTSCLISNGALTYSWTGPCGFTSTQQNPCFPFNLACTCNYSVTGTDANGCKNSTTVCIWVIPNPTVTANTSNTLLCVGQTATLTSGGANTFSWSTSATGSVTVVSPTITTTYSVTGTDINGCEGTTSITQSVSTCAGIKDLSSNTEVRIFPNPAKDQITISYSSPIKTIKIVSVDGKLVLQKNNTDNSLSQTINLSELKSGIYFVNCIIDGKENYFKVVKE